MTLYKTSPTEFILSKNNKAVHLTGLDKTIAVMKEVGIPIKEIEYSLTTLAELGHNVAKFGDINRFFLFSKKVG